GAKLLGFSLLSSTLGCCWPGQPVYQPDLVARILPPEDLGVPEHGASPPPPVQDGSDSGYPRKPSQADAPGSEEAVVIVPGEGRAVSYPEGRTITRDEAIATAFQLQPRLRVFLESVEQARGAEGVAFAPFLPTAVAGYSVGEFRLNAGGAGVPLGPLPGFTFIPFQGTIPIGLDISPSYELAELKLQWLLCDFGPRLGRYRQASIGVDMAQLQTQRAYQTVANEVSVAYYQVLRAQALRKTAQEAVRRSEDDLDVARKLGKRGVLEREKVLRAEVQLATNQR